MQLTGFHHLTAITAHARNNLDFYTRILGLRLVKKTVNQDDVSAYHLFYADGQGSPGTDITFFDWPVKREQRGTRSIVRTGFRLPSPQSLDYWAARLRKLNVNHGPIQERHHRPTLDFEDPEGQRLSFVVDETPAIPHPWHESPVPADHQILGLGPITLSVPALEPTAHILTDVMNMHPAGQFASAASDGSQAAFTTHVYRTNDAGPSAELHVAVEPNLPGARLGAGGAHHVAFRVPTFEQYDQWLERLSSLGVENTGPVNRFYFRSIYFREPAGILFELATDGPGFDADEPRETMGQLLSLPPFLEQRRHEIESRLKPL